MNYEGEKFLLKLYQDLDKQDGVLIAEKRSGKNSGNKYELLEKYLKRLERQEKIFDGEHQEMEQFLKNRYYEKADGVCQMFFNITVFAKPEQEELSVMEEYKLNQLTQTHYLIY